MNPSAYIPSTTSTLDDYIDATTSCVDPTEFAYFIRLSEDQWKRAKSLAKQAISYLSDTPYFDYIASYAPVEKAGECIMKSFLDYHCTTSYDCAFSDGDQFIASFNIAGIAVDVHTRMLRTTGSRINTNRFLLMVPELGLARRADVYVFCGYNVISRDGFAFGWATAPEIGSRPISTELRYQAKCIPLNSAHPMTTLLPTILSD